jgi:hypothetical protein
MLSGTFDVRLVVHPGRLRDWGAPDKLCWGSRRISLGDGPAEFDGSRSGCESGGSNQATLALRSLQRLISVIS